MPDESAIDSVKAWLDDYPTETHVDLRAVVKLAEQAEHAYELMVRSVRHAYANGYLDGVGAVHLVGPTMDGREAAAKEFVGHWQADVDGAFPHLRALAAAVEDVRAGQEGEGDV